MKNRLAGVMLAGLMIACTKFSEIVRDDTAGVNGSFEVVRSGLPVNWYVYTPQTIPTGDYDLILDTVEVKDGRQSLKFVVREAAPEGGRLSPGFSQEFDAPPGSTWTIGFWVRNAASDFIAKVGGVSGSESEMKTMAWSDSPFFRWKHFEYVYTVPQRFSRIRFELNVVRPGVFWVDNFTLTRAEPRP